ncbi:MAG: ubiquinol-cytochrome C chaperone [Rhodospirillaceae bacterium]|jgi:cytochrome b pre-mRNA-processing protein 3|nr:ubiquinol-cytochrome C chaperone [Rhodospirillaceae bacterium]MBT5245004.1 ubiquinol-cytochrome C chaperone [Rhodospirillaceae bacterium]MBT5561110.1 ubiquinol-cytochrome C chaperone [Rhodospirillaceae bacterium]MBT6241005.1 ubiquinol-cytochrome C chaperone [Rhodospirillaceae bacterium]
MNILKNFFSFSREKETAHKMYQIIVEQARLPVFYKDLGVADTFDGRFDMISLHMIIVIRRLKSDVEQTRKLSQALFDYMFDDIDLNLREMGIGDMGVLVRVKKMAKAFYGRLESYDQGLSQDDDTNLASALERNLFRENETTPKNLALFVAYMRREAARLDACTVDALMKGELQFSPPSGLEA